MRRPWSVAAWAATGAMVSLMATQQVGWTGSTYVASAQALTPYATAPAFPIAAAAVASRRWRLAVLSSLVAAAVVQLSRPLRSPQTQAPQASGATPLRLYNANLKHSNKRIDDVARSIEAVAADVLTFTEYTPEHADALLSSALPARYPHRLEFREDDDEGSAIWSRFPLTELAAPRSRFPTSAAVVAAPQPCTLYVVHPPSPLVSLRDWNDDLGHVGALHDDANGATIVLGDFNASFWHPNFRDVLAAGWRDAHLLLRRGLTSSWPTDKWPVPPFVRLDHALVNSGLIVTDVTDVDIPGSDHRGFVVSVAPAA